MINIYICNSIRNKIFGVFLGEQGWLYLLLERRRYLHTRGKQIV